jgi:hypothetical protein
MRFTYGRKPSNSIWYIDVIVFHVKSFSKSNKWKSLRRN